MRGESGRCQLGQPWRRERGFGRGRPSMTVTEQVTWRGADGQIRELAKG